MQVEVNQGASDKDVDDSKGVRDHAERGLAKSKTAEIILTYLRMKL